MLGTLRFQRRRHSMVPPRLRVRSYALVHFFQPSPALVCWRLAERASFNRQCHPAGIQPACNEATGQADRMDAKGHRPMRRRRGVRGGGEGGKGGRRGGAGRLPGARRAGGAVVPGGPGRRAAESERSLEDALGSALLIARFKSLRLYPDRIECKGEAIRLGEVLGIDAEMEGEVLRREHTNVNSWSRSVRTIDKRTAVVTVRTPEWEYSVRTGPGQEASARRFVEAARDVLADPGRYREWRDARIARGCRGPSRGRTPRGRRRPRPGPPSRPRGRTRGRSGTPRRSSRRSWHGPRRTTSPRSPRPTGKGPGALRPGRPPSPSASRSWARFWRSRSSPPSPQPFPPSPGPPSRSGLRRSMAEAVARAV